MTALREELKRKSLPGQQEAGRYQLALGLAQAVRGNLPCPQCNALSSLPKDRSNHCGP